MNRRISALMLFLAGCVDGPKASIELPSPATLQYALTAVRDLDAVAMVVPRNGKPLEAVALTRAEDGASFSGFVPADPGEYTLEVVFRGVAVSGAPDRFFLGRWVSDEFTVRAGASAPAAFSRPLDTRGRPEDESDLDGDGLSNLEEILSRSSPLAGDSDDDGVPDGLDCDPMDGTRTRQVAEGGSPFDCDGDGFRRTDVDASLRGDDCVDTDEGVFPGQTDDCGDTIDSDCDPATCPSNDSTPPVIDSVTPAESSRMGCFATFGASVNDANGVSSVSLEFIDTPINGGTPRTMLLRAPEAQPSAFRSGPLADVAAAPPTLAGSQRVRIRAIDGAGNNGTSVRTVEVSFTRPTAEISIVEDDVRVVATVGSGTPLVRLYAVPEVQGTYDANDRVEVESVKSGTDVHFTLPGSLEGTYLLFPVVEDAIGNMLTPDLRGQLYPSVFLAWFPCDLQSLSMPNLVVALGGTPSTGRRAYTMRELLPRATTAITEISANAVLTQISGFNVRADGTVDLTRTDDFLGRWIFGFYNPSTMEHIEVAFLSAAYTSTFPLVTRNAGNLSATAPIGDTTMFVDSDRIASYFGGLAGCSAPNGADDTLTWLHQNEADVVTISANGGSAQITPRESVSTLFVSCN